jgi:rhamnulokinase
LIAAFGFRREVFPSIVPSGTRLGPVLATVAQETGLVGVEVVATCSHDTGAAVAAVPAEDGEDWAYLSSGTWSLIGVELPEPLINAEVAAANFTNEGGYGGTTRFLKNIVGIVDFAGMSAGLGAGRSDFGLCGDYGGGGSGGGIGQPD